MSVCTMYKSVLFVVHIAIPMMNKTKLPRYIQSTSQHINTTSNAHAAKVDEEEEEKAYGICV